MMTIRTIATLGLLVGLLAGCSRAHYRRDADCETYGIIREKTIGTPWDLPDDEFTIEGDPRSRLADPTDPDYPTLPPTTPRLHTYRLPATSNRSPASGSGRGGPQDLQPAGSTSSPASTTQDGILLTARSELPPTIDHSRSSQADPADPSLARPGSLLLRPGVQAQQTASPLGTQSVEGKSALPTRPLEYAATLPVRPIPASFWQALPPECLTRMFEFESVQEEYARSFGKDARYSREQARRLSLEDIVELALLNSREYQTQKESLYRAALALTLERFAYVPKFSQTGNGTTVNYDHLRSAGAEVNTLSIASALQGDKLLATGGELLARFANDVVLTFNGPNGFAADINSELFFALSQNVFQRDIRFEPLIQSERNVVYAARDFARFRKTFFFQRATDYYTLLRRYRQIEIESQNYFSLVRALNQAEAEELAGMQARIQVEQIEQNMLQGRSRLSTACNALENGLDRLKIAMGLPTEQEIDLDLAELERLTRRDEVQVAGERASRARRRLDIQRQKEPPDRAEIINQAIVLNERLLDWLRQRQRTGEAVSDVDPLQELLLRLRVDDARLNAELSQRELEQARRAVPAAPAILLFQRTMSTVEAMLRLTARQQELAARREADPAAVSQAKEQLQQLSQRASELRDSLAMALKETQLEQLDRLQRETEQLLDAVQAQVKLGERLIGAPAERPEPELELKQTLDQINLLVMVTDQLLPVAQAGLVGVQVGRDDAMLTALSERLDLMNQRGQLADQWRAIKLAADELKSILNLGAAQTIGTHHNRPFGFTFDESQTQLNLALDLPLNRKAQRNLYRLALIDYQAALRQLMQLEDEIKLAVRDDQRDLALAGDQYLISVPSAALAAERVSSTRLELALGIPGVAARDFLESQDAYRNSLVAVADNHINHIIDRARLFLDLELMQLDQMGFWAELYDENYRPVTHRQLPADAGPPYGELPEFLKISHEMRRMLETCP